MLLFGVFASFEAAYLAAVILLPLMGDMLVYEFAGLIVSILGLLKSSLTLMLSWYTTSVGFLSGTFSNLYTGFLLITLAD